VFAKELRRHAISGFDRNGRREIWAPGHGKVLAGGTDPETTFRVGRPLHAAGLLAEK
jgi:hypothetical protein